ncbi:hypothetical protein C8R43DRAFT_984373 [Mycena crocata]|nr:hypothetical protein C8R43DRAFT_984373 [Mycena crocata]
MLPPLNLMMFITAGLKSSTPQTLTTQLLLLGSHFCSTKNSSTLNTPKLLKWNGLKHLPLPDIVLGDWNFVEDARDRLSGRKPMVPESFIRLKSLLQIEDGWRNTFQDTRSYTCTQRRFDPNTGLHLVSRSRLDRIYVEHTLFDACRGWRIDQTQVRSDHALVAVQLVCRSDQIHRKFSAVDTNIQTLESTASPCDSRHRHVSRRSKSGSIHDVTMWKEKHYTADSGHGL